MYNREQLQLEVPAIFATKPSPKMTSKYDFVPTIEIIEKFEQNGWYIASASQIGNNPYSIHQVKIRNREFGQVGDSIVEAIIKNSHNGLSTLSISAGLHRLVCSNGLTVPTSIASAISVKHMKLDMPEIQNLTEQFSETLPKIGESLKKMSETEMSDENIVDFANKAKLLRWTNGSIPLTLSIEELVSPVRAEDKDQTVWNVFNRVQEKFVRGGISYTTARGRNMTLRELKNISSLHNINTKLWELAESYC